MWIKIKFAGCVYNAWQCPAWLHQAYGLAPLPDGMAWAQLDSESDYRALQIA